MKKKIIPIWPRRVLCVAELRETEIITSFRSRERSRCMVVRIRGLSSWKVAIYHMHQTDERFRESFRWLVVLSENDSSVRGYRSAPLNSRWRRIISVRCASGKILQTNVMRNGPIDGRFGVLNSIRTPGEGAGFFEYINEERTDFTR